MGSIRLDYTYAGPFERWLYDIRDPVGLPIARYEVVYPGGDSTAVWSGAWTPFGVGSQKVWTPVSQKHSPLGAPLA